jgi:hypothetical protein
MAALPLLRAQLGGEPATAPGAMPTPEPAETTAYDSTLTGLAGYIRDCYTAAKDQRNRLGVDDRMLSALRSLRGEYDAQTLQAIKQFGGSEVYARIIASKVRSCSALLREIYTATDRPWSLSPTPDPNLPGPSVNEAVKEILQAEILQVQAAGMQADTSQIVQRAIQLRDEIIQQRRKVADDALRSRATVLDDILWDGGFYDALWDFLGDIATFPFAVIKGPVVRMENVLEWSGGKPTAVAKPVPKWHRCSPFDVYFAPWSQTPQDGYIIHRERVSRAALQAMIGLPGSNDDAIRRVLSGGKSASCDWYEYHESERADLEQRESTQAPISSKGNERPMAMLSFYGTISVKMLREWAGGSSRLKLPKEDDKDLSVFAYLVGSEVVGVSLNPHPTGRLPFYVDSFERVPGSCYGNAIPDLIDDVQSVGNAALRALVNNLSIASGPMAWINEDRIAGNDPEPTRMWPWKVWRFNDPLSSTASASEKPMDFFQPNANIEPLFTVYQQMLTMADELSTIPRFMQGQGTGVGGAGRTAAGLSMLVENGNRTIKQTVSSIDTNVIENAVEDLNVFLALTRSDVVMEGDISVVARGAVELMQRETLRMRRLEFLNLTNNPLDQQLVGVEGRFNVLREIARDLQLPTADSIGITEEQAKQIQQMLLMQAMQGAAGGGPNGQQTPPANQPRTPQQGVARPPANNPAPQQ